MVAFGTMIMAAPKRWGEADRAFHPSVPDLHVALVPATADPQKGNAVPVAVTS